MSEDSYRQGEKETEGFFLGIFVFFVVFLAVFFSSYAGISWLGGLPGGNVSDDFYVLKSFAGQWIPSFLLNAGPFDLNPDPARWFYTVSIFCCVPALILGFLTGRGAYRFFMGEHKKTNGRYLKRG